MFFLDSLVGHWPMSGDARDVSGNGLHAEVQGDVTFLRDADGGDAVSFGRGARIQVPAGARRGHVLTHVTVAVWVRAESDVCDFVGSIVSCFDPGTRTGFELAVQHGVSTGSQHNTANLEFGVDWGSRPQWEDHGRLGDSVAAWVLSVHDGQLYAGTLGADDRGHVFAFDGEAWHDLGPVGEANSVSALAPYRGQLHAGTTRYRAGGSGLVESTNEHPGGSIHRLDPSSGWVDAGQLDDVDSISGFAVHRGALYASASYQRGVFRHTDGATWNWCGDPGRRLLALGVFDGHLFGAGNDHVNVDEAIRLTRLGEVVPAESPDGGGGVFQFTPPDRWDSWGMLPDTTQVYSLAVSDDALHASTWPNGLVYRHEHDETWSLLGRLGAETEVMGLITYNGVLYGGTLPHAQLFRYVRQGAWEHVGTLDVTPNALYRRAAGLAVFNGKLFCGTLPSGRVHAMRTGNVVTHDRALTAGWHHVVATRQPGEIALYVDGSCVARSRSQDEPVDVLPDLPLTIGNGTRTRFGGLLRDFRLFGAVATPDDVRTLFQDPYARDTVSGPVGSVSRRQQR